MSALPRLQRAAWIGLNAGFATLIAVELALLAAVVPFRYPTELLAPERGGPLVIRDRTGELLSSVPAADGSPGREAWVSLDRVPSHAVLALLASEDSRFFRHAGVDPWGLVRAAWLNLRAGRSAFGGSTITMQLVRLVHSAGRERTPWLKLKEAVLALRLERVMSKRAILEQYVNRAPFGNGAHGIEAAARTYFGKPAASLSVGEATLVAVIPRGPRTYDPLRHLGRTLRRRDHVFGLLLQQGLISDAEVRRAQSQSLALALHRPPFRSPHFVAWALTTLPAELRRGGGQVTTTLDLALQESLQHRLAEHVAALRAESLEQAGMVVLDTASGQVLALVGSSGFLASDGQVNIVTRRRNPGSALKPFVYALAIEAGDSPASIAYDILDVPSLYRAQQTTQPERGPVRYREALAGSYNLAAVHVLERVGVEQMVSRLRQAGVAALSGSPRDYGLRLALGSAKVRLLDLASAYRVFVRAGRAAPLAAVLQVTRADGTVWRPPPPVERQVFSPAVAWLVMDMLADPEARRAAFGQELPFDLPFPVAAKTGTARGFSDTVAIGVTRELTVGAWGGRFDGKATSGLTAMTGAAPLVRDGLLIAGRGQALTLPSRPSGITSAAVCPLSGELAGDDCPQRKQEVFVAGKLPRRSCHWHRRVGGRLTIVYPPEIGPWVQRQRTAGGRHL